MSHELVKREDTAVVAPGDLLTAIARAASDPNVDVVKMQALYAMHKEMLTDQRREAFDDSMARLQSKLEQFGKFGKAKNSRFVQLEDIDTVTRPLLKEEGFSVICSEESSTETTATFALTISKGGHERTVRKTFSTDRAAKNREGSSIRPAIQDDGSTITYARRYLIKMALNIIEKDADTDGNDPTTLDKDQILDMETAIADSNTKLDSFLTKIAGYPSIAAIPASQYKRCMQALETKKQGMQK